MAKCSRTTFHGLAFLSLATKKLRTHNAANPQIMLMIIANESSNNKIGRINVDAKTSLAKKVPKVDSQTYLEECFSDSSEIWMPSESEKASAIAIIKIPPIIGSLE